MTITTAGSLPAATLCAANDNARFRGGYPTLNWLAKKNPDAALAAWNEIRDAGHALAAERQATPREYNTDDAGPHEIPDEPLTSETMAEPTQDGPDEIWPEVLHEVRPSIDEMLVTAGGIAWPWCGERVQIDGTMRCRGEPWAYQYAEGRHALDDDKPGKRWTAHLGGLTFYLKPGARKRAEGGLMVSYTDANGCAQRPAYVASKPRGGKRPHRTKAAAEAYLARLAAIASPLRVEGHQRPMSGEPALIHMYTPLLPKAPDAFDKVGRYGVAEARKYLAEKGVDGSVPFDALQFPVTRCPTVPAKGARFLAGISGAKQTASVPAPNWQEREVRPLSPVLERRAVKLAHIRRL